MNKIGILTSGGDAPGMNAAIHAIVTTANFHNIECIGFERGYNGLIDNVAVLLPLSKVKHISHLGGTILKSARCPRMLEPKFQKIAAENMQLNALDAFIVIGGDGSFQGAHFLSQLTSIPIIGVPGTIDNDIDGTDNTIGFDTAANTALDAIDKIRDTADAFERIFIVEVMGRHSGQLALNIGVAAEAEHVLCPEMHIPPHQIIQNITTHINTYLNVNPHASYIIVTAENTYPDGSIALADMLSNKIGIDCRASVLGHMQRGGMASCVDRILATKLGAFSVESLLSGAKSRMAGEVKGQLILTPLADTGLGNKKIDPYLLNIYSKKLSL
jgi:6-phosphofructokinase 1